MTGYVRSASAHCRREFRSLHGPRPDRLTLVSASFDDWVRTVAPRDEQDPEELAPGAVKLFREVFERLGPVSRETLITE